MASENAEPEGRQLIPPAVRRRLQQQFQAGSQKAATGNFDYATDMFTMCVKGDLGNYLYVQNFLDNLCKKYGNNKKGGKLAGARGLRHKGTVKKAVLKKDWETALVSGLEMLKLNPWDASTLSAMANACERLEFDECQLAYLKKALDANQKGAEINRLCGRALGRQGQYDQAIVCWHRVEQAKPGDQEAQKAIGDLTVEKTIHQGGYESAKSATDVMAEKQAQAERGGRESEMTPEQRLERAINRDPGEVSNYVELADLLQTTGEFAKSEKVLARALEASGGDISIQERLEDAQLRLHRQHVDIAKQKAATDKTKEAEELHLRMRVELNNKELEVYRNRSERYPNNLGYKFELGLRLKRAGMYREAITAFQEASKDSKRKSGVLLALGGCFHKIKQYKLAMTNFEKALAAIPERDEQQRKEALYAAGSLALMLRDLEKADKYLTELAGMDFGYLDVANRLDKLTQLRDEPPPDDMDNQEG